MSITAVAMRRNGHTWAEIAEKCRFISPAAARECAMAAARFTSDTEDVDFSEDDDGGS